MCERANIDLAYQKAKKGKSEKDYVISFAQNYNRNIDEIEGELKSEEYQPHPMKTIVIKEPKSRTIRKSIFKDRVVQHSTCNVITEMFEKTFIYDSICKYMEGWLVYAKQANTFNLRRRITSFIESKFKGRISLLQIDRLITIVRMTS